MRRVAAVLLVAVALQGCALNTVRHRSTVSIVALHATLAAIDDVEMGIVCGRAGAPQAPLCVPISKHRIISIYLRDAYALEIKAGTIIRNLPPGSPTPAEVISMAVQVNALIQEVMKLLPNGKEKQALVEKTGLEVK